MHGKAFVALRSSKFSLSLQETSSGLCLSEKPDLKMSSLRKSVGFGRVAVVYFALLHYIPAALCQSSSSNSGKDRKVCMEGNCLGFLGKSTTFLMKRLIKVLLCLLLLILSSVIG